METTMKTRRIGKRLGYFGGAAALILAFSGSTLGAGITGTKHNLSSTGSGPNHTTGTDQICVFCHTPHGSDTSAPVPLWNKKLNVTNASYTTYDSLNTATLNGNVLSVGSVSLACLSCHDGTQAMDNIINAPGSGGYSSTGGGAAGIALGTWTGVNKLATSPFPNLGTDLRNDHPIGIEYCGGGLTGSGTTVSGSCTKNTDFISGSAGTTSDGRTAQVKTASINNNQVFWIALGGSTYRAKTDIHLYTRDFSGKGGSAAGPSVECGSCHDPHVDSKGSDNIMFMRVTTSGSQICLSCHTK
jgi:predicted CXXCH cytochrome family protein